MKKLLLLPLPLLLVLSLARAQAITQTPGVPHTTGTPTGAPSPLTKASWLRFDKTNKILYRWTGSAWTATLPGAVAPGSITNTELASSTGGIYKGSGTVPASTLVSAANGIQIDGGNTGVISIGDLDGATGGARFESGSTYAYGGEFDSGYYFMADIENLSAFIQSPVATVECGNAGLNLTSSGTILLVTDSRATPRGLQYNADYSATYDNRSLVDKAYVVAQNSTNANLTGPVTSVGNATTITANSIDSTKVAASGLSPSDLGPSGASVGQVMTYTVNGWRAAAAAALADGDKGDITVSSSGADWELDPSSVGSSEIAASAVEASEIAAGAVDSTKVSAGGLSPSDIGQSGASVGQMMQYTANGWRPVTGVLVDGNSLGAALQIGTNDAQNFNLEVAGLTRIRIASTGRTFIGSAATATAFLQLAAGAASASNAPLKFSAGTNLTTPEAGAIEFDGTNYYATSSTTRYTLAKTLTATASLNFPSVAASTCSDLTVTVTGAADGDGASVGVPNASILANGSYTWWASAANTVTVRFCNHQTVGALDPASGTFRATVLKY